MRGRHTRSWGWLALTLGMTPGVFFLEHWGPGGMPTAEGCSGAAPVAAPRVRIWRPSGAELEDLATDGFFVFETYGASETLVSTTQVSVTTLDGAPVTGELFTVKGSERSYLAWQADAPLAIGTKVKVVVEAETVPGGSFVSDGATFEVRGGPAELGAGSLSFESWRDYRHGVGEPVSCTSTLISSCVSTTQVLSVFGSEVPFPAVYAAWHAGAELHGFTLWEVDVTARAPAPGVPAPTTLVVVDPNAPPQLNTLVFAEDAPSHCLTIRVKDLRSGDVETAEQCTESRTAPTVDGISRDYPLSSCDAPPSAELTQAWCDATESTSPVCQPMPEEPTQPLPAEPLPAEPQPTNDAAERASRTSSGCQLALVGASAAGGSVGGFGAVVGVLSLSNRRRRRA